MGLIKAAVSAGSSVLADQWKEYFYCDSLPENVLMIKGAKRTGKRSSNTKGSDNVISNGSVISVADGQAMIIVDDGRIVEFCGEAGKRAHTDDVAVGAHHGNSLQKVFGLVTVHDDATLGLELPGPLVHVKHDDIHAQVHRCLLSAQSGTER